jgi:hypothetical protein
MPLKDGFKDPNTIRKTTTVGKKAHTLKNLVITTCLGLIVFATQTVSGKVHDKKLADLTVGKCTLKLKGDSGFQGLEKDWIHVQLPYKKPQNGELTEEQKNYNHQLAKKRVRIEYSFAKIKRFRVFMDVFRSPAEGFRDSIFKIVCDLYNYLFNRKLEQAF